MRSGKAFAVLIECCSKFFVATYYDALRHLLTQLNERLSKRQAR
jgi:hypothetical protein